MNPANVEVYRGDPGVPHASVDVFQGVVAATFGFLVYDNLIKDKLFTVQPRYITDAALALCEEIAAERAARQGKEYVKMADRKPKVAKNLRDWRKWRT
eukprot:jgi/Chlat1/6411/Chrsp45S05913